MPAAYVHKVAEFEGPLDLLLSLIHDRKLHINDIALADVADGYLGYIQESTADLPDMAQFIVVASTLLLIKSRSLLPNLELTEDEEQSIEDLKERLAHYQAIRDTTKGLRALWGIEVRYLPFKQPYVPPIRFDPTGVSLEGIEASMRGILQSLPTSTFKGDVRVEKTISLEEMIGQLETRIMNAARTSFKSLSAGGNKVDVILQFLALLELVKGGSIMVEQRDTFDDILIETQHVSVPRYD